MPGATSPASGFPLVVAEVPTGEGIDHFDAVVIGSGFGGSVVAERLSGAGKTVCVLERGKAYPPTSFPRDPTGLAHNLWDPGNGLHGMFDIWSFKGIESVVCSGLGGGSLIYANVLIRKDERWFVREDPRPGGYEYWPITRETLDPHYDAVEAGLNASPYPFGHAPYNRTPKTLAMQEAAGALGLKWLLPNLAITWGNPGKDPVPGEVIEGGEHNLHHATRTTCRLCGECDIGCNYGAKNTLDYTYLSRAAEHGAEIRTLSEVRSIGPGDGGGYTVRYRRHDPDNPTASQQAPLNVLHADRLIVSAGALGSPYLLLRNRSAFPAMSNALGTHFSGNGDLLTFLTHTRANGKPRLLESSVGPVITSAIRMPDEVDGVGVHGRGFYIEDGGNPAFLNYLMESTSAASLAVRSARFVLARIVAHAKGDPRSNYSSQIARLFDDTGAAATSLPVLTMGRDIADGVMSLRDGDLAIDWTTATSRAYFERVETTLGMIAHALGGRYLNTPLWLFKRVITVHPLGGCPMGRDPREGVVDSWGEVFGHPRMYVADGSVMPGPVGPNPSLTIAAFADRVADGILSR
jgi:cholesterol oxidase